LNREGGYYLATGAMFHVLWLLVLVLSKTINQVTCKVETLSVSTSLRQAITESESTSTHTWVHFHTLTKVIPNYTSVPIISTILLDWLLYPRCWYEKTMHGVNITKL